MDSFKKTIDQCRELQRQRRELEAKAKELKEQENALKVDIIDYMNKNNLPSVHFKNEVQVVLSEKNHLEVIDKEKFAEATMRALAWTFVNHIPFTNGLLCQCRPSKDIVNAYLEENQTLCLADLGLQVVNQPEIAFRSKS